MYEKLHQAPARAATDGASLNAAPTENCILIGLRWLCTPKPSLKQQASLHRSGTVLNLSESSPPTRGHRFTPPQPPQPPHPISPFTRCVEAKSFFVPPPADAPRVLLLDPGSGESCAALQMSSMHVHLAAAPAYDEQVCSGSGCFRRPSGSCSALQPHLAALAAQCPHACHLR